MAELGSENTGFIWRILDGLYEDILDWCAGRSWLIRAPLLVFFGYVAVRQLGDLQYNSLFGAINLGIHEGGHLLFNAFGQFLGIAGGTILQLFAPLAAMIVFLKQRDYFGIAVCFGWLSTNLYGVGVYQSDALAMRLDLVTVGDSQGPIIHDWRWLFTHLGLLNHCEAIGWMTCRLGDLAMLLCLGGGSWLLWRMATAKAPQRQPTAF